MAWGYKKCKDAKPSKRGSAEDNDDETESATSLPRFVATTSVVMDPDDIVIPENFRESDWEIVVGIAESMPLLGQPFPVLVHKVAKPGAEWGFTPTVLVEGLELLEAVKLKGWKTVECKFVTG